MDHFKLKIIYQILLSYLELFFFVICNEINMKVTKKGTFIL